jgi:hypothetical protein
MTTVARIVSWLALGATIGPAVLFYVDMMALDQMKLWMLVATVAWFASAPVWMDQG